MVVGDENNMRGDLMKPRGQLIGGNGPGGFEGRHRDGSWDLEWAVVDAVAAGGGGFAGGEKAARVGVSGARKNGPAPAQERQYAAPII